MGHRIRLRSNAGKEGHDIFGQTLGDDGRDPNESVRQHHSIGYTTSDQNMHGHNLTHSIPNASPREPTQSRYTIPRDDAAIPLNDQKSVHLNERISGEDPIALAERKFEVDEGWSGDEDERYSGPNQPPGSVRERRGDHLFVMAESGNVTFHRISPIPFDVHKMPPVHTPSIYSDDTAELGNHSPSFLYSQKADIKQAYKDLALTSMEEPEIRTTDLSEERSQDVEKWLNHTENSPPSIHRETFGNFEIYQDSEHDGRSPGGHESNALNFEVLRDSEHDSFSPRSIHEGTAEADQIREEIEPSDPSLPDGQNETGNVFAIWEDNELENLASPGKRKRTAESFEIREDDDVEKLTPPGKRRRIAESYEIRKNNHAEKLTPHGKRKRTAESFEDSGNNEPKNLAPLGKRRRIAESFKIQEDVDVEKLTPHGKRRRIAEFFEGREENDLETLAPPAKRRRSARSFDVWNDAKHGCPSASQPITVLPFDVLSNVTNIPHPQHLMTLGSARTSATASEMRNNVGAKRVASLRRARKLPRSRQSPFKNEAELPEVGQAYDGMNSMQFASASSALQDHDIDHPPCPPDSFASSATCSDDDSLGDEDRTSVLHHRRPLIETESRSPRSPFFLIPPCPPNSCASLAASSSDDSLGDEDGISVSHHRRPLVEIEPRSPSSASLSSVANNHATPAEGRRWKKHGSKPAKSFEPRRVRLEGSMAPEPIFSTQRLAPPRGIRGGDGELEGHGLHLDQPSPRRRNNDALLERLHGIAERFLIDSDGNMNTCGQ